MAVVHHGDAYLGGVRFLGCLWFGVHDRGVEYRFVGGHHLVFVKYHVVHVALEQDEQLASRGFALQRVGWLWLRVQTDDEYVYAGCYQIVYCLFRSYLSNYVVLFFALAI